MTCKDCKWAVAQSKQLSMCYRYPPQVVVDNASKELPEGRQFFHESVRPIVWNSDLACGEFQERPA